MRAAILTCLMLVAGVMPSWAQPQTLCRVLCTPEFKIEPTFTFSDLFGEEREAEFEVIFALGLPTRMSWLEFTVDAIVLPFDRESTPELEFETNVVWLSGERTGGWISSHFDIVDKFSPAERATDRRAYTQKLNLELDTSVSIFNWLPDGRWLRGVELEGSLDYVATGLPKGARPWSFSIVFVLPVAPM